MCVYGNSWLTKHSCIVILFGIIYYLWPIYIDRYILYNCRAYLNTFFYFFLLESKPPKWWLIVVSCFFSQIFFPFKMNFFFSKPKLISMPFRHFLRVIFTYRCQKSPRHQCPYWTPPTAPDFTARCFLTPLDSDTQPHFLNHY